MKSDISDKAMNLTDKRCLSADKILNPQSQFESAWFYVTLAQCKPPYRTDEQSVSEESPGTVGKHSG